VSQTACHATYQPSVIPTGFPLVHYTLLQILSVTLFEKMPIQQALQGGDYQSQYANPANQLNLFDS
jgi:hypothetical protein